MVYMQIVRWVLSILNRKYIGNKKVLNASVSIKFQLWVHKQETRCECASIHVLQNNGEKTKVKYSLTVDVIG